MSDEAKTESPEDLHKKRLALITKLIAGVIVALPGAYGALKSSGQVDESKVAIVETKAKAESTVRDRQENDLQKHVAALRVEVSALRATAVTHKELIALVVKLQVATPPRRRPSAREVALKAQVNGLKVKAAAASVAEVAADVTTKALPELKPAARVRRTMQAQKKMKFPDDV